ncbi:MAG: phytanoyl-CoA dioxygenase family protein [Chloroflexota bacterium]|nr:phytanoyl-CoA dioxygenase family protein [Chloroflexota bacterium]
MDMQTALSTFGVSDDTLSGDEIQHLDERGYLPLPAVMSPEEVSAIRERVRELMAEEGEEAGSEFGQERGAVRLANLVDKDPLFEICFSHPRVLAAMDHVLKGDFKLSSLNGRASVPSDGLQAFHADWSSSVDPSDFQVCNSIWLLVDFTAENGATRVVPGSHRSGQLPSDVMDNPWEKHPQEILLTGAAGTVVIFNSHLWHAGTANHSDTPRYALHSYFTRRHNAQQMDQKAFLSERTLGRLSPAQRFILDV